MKINWKELSRRMNDPYLGKRIGVPKTLIFRTDLYQLSIDQKTLFYIRDNGEHGEPLCEDFRLSKDVVLEYCGRMCQLYKKLRIHDSEPLIIVLLSYLESLPLFICDIIGKGWSDIWLNYGPYLVILLLFLFQSTIFNFLYGRYLVRKIRKRGISSIEKFLDCHYRWAYTNHEVEYDENAFSSDVNVLDL